MTNQPPREFWISLNPWLTAHQAFESIEGCLSKDKSKLMHVIDYSKYQSLLQLANEMREALEFYAKAPCHPTILEVAPMFRRMAIEALSAFDKGSGGT
jgi:hypothetical protein